MSLAIVAISVIHAPAGNQTPLGPEPWGPSLRHLTMSRREPRYRLSHAEWQGGCPGLRISRMIALALLLTATSADPIVGTWEGSSLCQVKPSPCHDEHVLYRFISTRQRHYRIDAYKLVVGKQLFMGAIDVGLDAAGSELDGLVMSGGQSRGRLQLSVKNAHLSGRMTLTDGTLYRLIEVDKH